MLSASSPLLVLFLTVLQLVLLVDAKGGGKGAKGSKSSKKKPKTKVKHVYKENGKCYDEQRIEVPCPHKTNTALIIGIIAGVVGVILIIALAIWLFKRRSQKKNKKSLNIKSRGLDDASSDRESIVPLVQGDMKESDSLYSYKDKSMHV